MYFGQGEDVPMAAAKLPPFLPKVLSIVIINATRIITYSMLHTFPKSDGSGAHVGFISSVYQDCVGLTFLTTSFIVFNSFCIFILYHINLKTLDIFTFDAKNDII
jgi:hypothetical protein